MSYWWDYNVPDFLFKGYSLNSKFGLFATCLMLCSFAIFFEFMKVLKARLRQMELRKRQQNLRNICNTEDDSEITSNKRTLLDAMPTNK